MHTARPAAWMHHLGYAFSINARAQSARPPAPWQPPFCCPPLFTPNRLESYAPSGSLCRHTAAAAPDTAATAAAANKQNVADNLYAYILQHTREAPVLRELRADTVARFPQAAHMAVSPEQGAFLAWLVGALGVRRIVELGVFTGYSSIAMALALPADGKLIACDRDPTAMAIAAEYWERGGVAGKVEARVGPAMESLQALLDDGEAGTFDFAFVDADKRKYREYYEALLRLVRPGGVIAIDNVLWYGKVADPGVGDKATLALRELNAFLAEDTRVVVSLVPIGDGLTLCRRL